MHTYSEGCIAIVARDYAWFLSDAQIPELEDDCEADVGSEEDSEEASEEEVHDLLVYKCLATGLSACTPPFALHGA